MQIKLLAALSIALVTVTGYPGVASAADLPRFRVPGQFQSGVVPGDNRIADFTEDGRNDVAVTDPAVDGVTVLPGDGAGNLGAPIVTRLPDGGGAFSLDEADFNGDGRLDLIVAFVTATASQIAILLGTGTGTFTLSDELPNGYGDVVAAEFNGDAHPDIAYSGDTTGSGQAINVAFGNGDGTFGPVTSYRPGLFISHDDLQAADVDGDADIDLVYLEGCPNVRLNAGDGTFGPDICSPDPKGRLGGVAMALGDYDQNGILDMATVDASGGHVTIGLGTGDGHFTFFRQYSNIGPQVNWIVCADFNGDGRLDLMASENSALAVLLLGVENGTFLPPVRWITGASELSAGQLGGNPLPDVVSAGGLVQDAVAVSLNMGRATFHAPRLFDTTGQAGGIEIGDLNGDGRGDVALVVESSRIEARLGARNGTFGRPIVSNAVAGDTGGFRLADVNEDGRLDVVGVLDTFTPHVYVMLGTGTGRFGPAATFANGGNSPASGLAVADVNEDGNLDAVTSTSSKLSVLPGTGTGSFGPPILSGFGGGSAQVATLIADYNGDGNADAVSVEVTGSPDFAGTVLHVNHGAGNGTFTVAYTRSADTNSGGAGTADLNGDGRPDVAIAGVKGSNSGRTGLFVFLNVGGTLTNPNHFVSGADDLQLADLNGDGAKDAATLCAFLSGCMFVNVNDGDGTFETNEEIPLAAEPISLENGDTTGDGRQDLVVLYGLTARSRFAPYVNEAP